ncbi:MAG: 2-oxo acid dehydrogenase subunit E2 [Planctomycetales bacterium]
MYWPTKPGAVPLDELGWINTTYLAMANVDCDPTIVWGTTVETEPLEAFLVEERRKTGLLISPAHLLVRVVAEALQRHPALRRRAVGRRMYHYDGVNITMPMLQTRTGEVDVVFLRRVQDMTLADVARSMWNEARDVALRAADADRQSREGNWLSKWKRALARRARLTWIHRMAWLGFWITNRFRLPTTCLDEINGSNAFVNFLGFPGAPPMISYKPSTLPTNSFGVSVTMGPAEPRPVVVQGEVAVRKQASVFVRVDHRLVNGHQTAQFVNTVRGLLLDPQVFAHAVDAPPASAHPHRRAA